jgi:type II secretory pathway pseudopilin PulG
MKNKGFTLLEITVVISIIIFLGTIFFADYRGVEKQFALKRSANQLAQGLRKAQELALSCRKTPPELGSESFPGGGYGIYLEKGANSYVLFADCDDDQKYDKSSTKRCDQTGDPGVFSEKIEEVFLEKNIKISEFYPSFSGTYCPVSGVNCLDISFIPPNPTVYLNDGSFEESSIILTFDGISKKTITINKAGLVDILNQ